MIRIPQETLDKKIAPKDFPTSGHATAALRELQQRRGPMLHEAGYGWRVARRMISGSPSGFYLEVYPLHPHRHSPEAERRAYALIREYCAMQPQHAVELARKEQ